MKKVLVLLFLFGLFALGNIINVNNNVSYSEDDLEGVVLEGDLNNDGVIDENDLNVPNNNFGDNNEENGTNALLPPPDEGGEEDGGNSPLGNVAGELNKIYI